MPATRHARLPRRSGGAGSEPHFVRANLVETGAAHTGAAPLALPFWLKRINESQLAPNSHRRNKTEDDQQLAAML